ncbi:hypothetical protein [uncultured Erythrobacter sp.]|uniref:hypothetical protein n=1 Tax=uncultured Erythrobacter sp. TaxID=263913 RepID=UPI0026134F9F|nr:hypothetical protein [uncultured Erythrobacter sp.]
MASVPNNRFTQDEARRDADHVSFLKYRRYRWLWIAVILSIITALGYAFIDQDPRPNGGSWYGYTLGTIGLGLIVWLSLLGVRKRRISEGQWSLKAWTSAHVYLGLALIVVGTLHTGFHSITWNVHWLAYFLMLLVIFSGAYGLYVYAKLPTTLSAGRREMTRGDMLEELSTTDRQLDAAAQPLDREQADLVIAALGQDIFSGGAFGRLTGAYPGCKTARALSGFDENGSDTEQRVHRLLSQRADQLGLIRRNLRTKALLEVWLFIHIPATIALLAALLVHVLSVFYYW